MVQQLLAWMFFGSVSAQTYPNVNVDFEMSMQPVKSHLQGKGSDASGDVLLYAARTVGCQDVFTEMRH